MEKYKIIDSTGNVALDNIGEAFFDFINDMDRMISLYKRQRYGQAEVEKIKLSEKLDDIDRF